jgi:hypothetical protein
MKQQIEPAYATFEQGKKLKEKGFNVKCESYFLEDEIEYSYPKPENWNLNTGTISCPEQWQIVEWLRVEKGIWIGLVADDDYTFKFEINTWSWYELEKSHRLGHRVLGQSMWDISSEPYKSPQEAYSAAFDYILKEMI